MVSLFPWHHLYFWYAAAKAAMLATPDVKILPRGATLKAVAGITLVGNLSVLYRLYRLGCRFSIDFYLVDARMRRNKILLWGIASLPRPLA